MKIGVMLRAMDEKGGIGVYSRNLMDNLLPLDTKNDYILFYRNATFLGRYAHYGHVRERLLMKANKVIWDQVLVPLEAKREGVDLIFHTKFTVPFLTRRKTVMTIHGASWFTHPELYNKYDIAYIRAVMPFYCRKATAILSNSDLTSRDFIHTLGISASKLRTTRLAAGECFAPIDDLNVLNQTREKYGLPHRFVLSVIKYDPRKNFRNLIKAFKICHSRVHCKLVVVGKDCERYRDEYLRGEPELDRDVVFLGWVEQEDLIGIYNLADCLFFPSIYEEFGIPVCEAMACGCPVVVSNTGAFPEIAGEAGIFVDPKDPWNMGETLYRVWMDEAIRKQKGKIGLVRSQEFSWKKCAMQTLELFESVHNNG